MFSFRTVMLYKSVQAHIYGRVQGVFFRDCTRRKGIELGLSGWVRNCSDGSVECAIQGESNRVDAMISWLSRGSPSSEVDNVVILEAVQDPSLTAFDILY
jgi:acylphosphatase